MSREAISKIKELGNAYIQYEEMAGKAQRELEDYVNKYLKEHNLKENMQAVSELADILPAGSVRFRMLDLYFELQERSENMKKVREKGLAR